LDRHGLCIRQQHPSHAFQQNADILTPKVIIYLKFASYVFYPIPVAFAFLTRQLARLLGKEEGNAFTIREEISSLMQGRNTQGDIGPEEQSMIRRVFDFGETRVAEVFVPLIDVVVIAATASCREAISVAAAASHRHLPVFRDRVDNIVGILDTLSLIGIEPEEKIETYYGAVSFVPGSQSIEKLLLDMRAQMQSVAIVVDEYGGADGLVAIEDLLEEVVGELVDEHDEGQLTTMFEKVDRRTLKVSARMSIDDLMDTAGIELPKGNYETVGGFLNDLAQSIPEQGSILRYRKFEFVIDRLSGQAIKEVTIRW
jgi:putative hemolysin